MKRHIAFVLFIAVILNSCSIEKRIYQPGYFISGRSSSPKEEKIQKKIQNEIFSESLTTFALEDSSEVIDSEDTTRIKLNVSDPKIEASNVTKILPHEILISAALASDSIPDEGKILLAKYEKNHTAKKKIRKIGFYPLIVTAFGFLMTGIFFIPWGYGALNNDNVFFTFLFTFLIGFAVLIPFIIVYIILTIITKKQRRKLRRMGLIK